MTVIDEATGHVRRSAPGRLYHGETAIDFYGRRWWGLGISALLVLVSIGSLLVNGIERSLDFKGGVVWEIESPDLTEARARELLDANELDGGTAKVQVLTAQDGTRTVEVQVGPQPDAVRTAMQAVFAEEIGATPEDINSTSVSSTWGKTITDKAIFALSVFLVLVALLAKFAWGPLLQALESRQASIRKSLDDAQKAKQELERLHGESQQLLAQARAEAADIVSRSRADAERFREDLKQKAKAEAAALLKNAERQIELQTAQAVQQIRQETVDLSIGIASKLLQRNVSREDNERLIDETFKQLETARTPS